MSAVSFGEQFTAKVLTENAVIVDAIHAGNREALEVLMRSATQTAYTAGMARGADILRGHQ